MEVEIAPALRQESGSGRRSLSDRLKHKLERFLKKRRKRARRRRADRAIAKLAKFPRHGNAPRHGLPGKLIVSLTSYPGRFFALHLTLKSLLDQTVKPDLVVLWIAHDELAALPEAVLSLASEKFAIRPYDNLRSYKKIVPTLLAYPDAFIVVCDDDAYYPDNWLERLVGAYDPQQPSVVCHRGHRLAYTGDGTIAPYRSWQRNVSDKASRSPAKDLVPTGIGGVLYPPGSLAPQVTDRELINRLNPMCDDTWLFFMLRQAGWSTKRVAGRKRDFLIWPNTQEQSLGKTLRDGKKDEYIKAMSSHFGIPAA